MFNSAMKTSALQQHKHFTNALQAAGVKAFLDASTNSHYIQRGPVTYIARPKKADKIADLRQIDPNTICVVNADSPADISLKSAGFRKLMTPASVAEINLSKPLQPHGKWRYALRKSECSPVKTSHRPFKLTQDHWFLDADKRQQRDKKFRAMTHLVPLNWPPRDTLISIASHKGSPIAAMLFLIHGNAATYQIAWTGALGRDFCAHHRLLYEAAQHLSIKGTQRLDLGTIDTVNSPNLARFKIGAGATVRQLGGTWAALPSWRR